jgi:hypothetical protein
MLNMMRSILRALATQALVAIASAPAIAQADQAVGIGGALALLNKPESPRASLILIPGSDGQLRIQKDGSFSGLVANQLVRTRKDYLKHGIATLTVDHDLSIPASIAYMRQITSPVVVVATSRGSLRVPAGLSAKPDGIVLTAALLDDLRGMLGSPALLPRTLVLHHRQDGCYVTPPTSVPPFEAWGGTKVTVIWMTGGIDAGDACRARSHHGFNGLDDLVVSTVAQFATSRR